MNKTYQELCDENQHLREGIRAAATKLDARELRVTVTTDPDLQALDHAISLSRTDRDDALNVAIKGLNAALLARNGRQGTEKEAALAAHVERLHKAIDDFYGQAEEMHRVVGDIRDQPPETSLAQRDARVAADELYRLYRDSDGDNSVPRGIVLKRAEEKRREAEGGAR
ncbi:hypothetical protein KZO85_00130 [Chromohalobacter canadensis]|uniref:hypothetical protein n=1 Tax=Chromohalobacter canadensis TaxID=141389 RepID=UPI0021C1A5C5|nr:hypothetical protein [Chromohalobacter canadensis]MCT8466983.1 hypothetical protein [Chromohalobacter canadensis]